MRIDGSRVRSRADGRGRWRSTSTPSSTRVDAELRRAVGRRPPRRRRRRGRRLVAAVHRQRRAAHRPPSSRRGSTTSARGSSRRCWCHSDAAARERAARRQAALARRARARCSTCSLKADARDGERPRRPLLRRRRSASPTPRRRSTSCRRPTRSPPSTASATCCCGRSTPPASPRPGQPGAAGRRRRRRRVAPAAADRAPPTRTLPPARPIEELLAELDALVGLDHVKADVRRLTSLLRIQQLRERARPADDRDQPPPRVHRQPGHRQDHRRPAAQPDLLRTLGVVSKGHLVETDRSHLVAGYVGQTATRTREPCWSRRSAARC